MRPFFALVLLIGAGLFPAQLRAQQVIQVELELMPEIANRPLAAERQGFRDSLAEEMRKSVAKHLPYWEFRLQPIAKSPKLTMAITSLGKQSKPESWGADVEMWITNADASEIPVLPKTILIEKGQLESLIDAEPQALADEIKTSFGRLLRSARDKCLETAIKVPLVDGTITPRSADRVEAVLPLQWDRFQRSARSEFRIEFRIPNVGVAVIYSQGTGLSGQDASPPIEGIVVRHHRWLHPGRPTSEEIAMRIGELAMLKRGVILFNRVPVESNYTPPNPEAEALPNP